MDRTVLRKAERGPEAPECCMWKPGEARRPPELLERYVSNDTSMIIICGLRGDCGPETLERSLGAPATGRPKVQIYARGSRAKPEGLRPLHDKHEDCKRSLTTNPKPQTPPQSISMSTAFSGGRSIKLLLADVLNSVNEYKHGRKLQREQSRHRCRPR